MHSGGHANKPIVSQNKVDQQGRDKRPHFQKHIYWTEEDQQRREERIRAHKERSAALASYGIIKASERIKEEEQKQWFYLQNEHIQKAILKKQIARDQSIANAAKRSQYIKSSSFHHWASTDLTKWVKSALSLCLKGAFTRAALTDAWRRLQKHATMGSSYSEVKIGLSSEGIKVMTQHEENRMHAILLPLVLFAEQFLVFHGFVFHGRDPRQTRHQVAIDQNNINQLICSHFVPFIAKKIDAMTLNAVLNTSREYVDEKYRRLLVEDYTCGINPGHSYYPKKALEQANHMVKKFGLMRHIVSAFLQSVGVVDENLHDRFAVIVCLSFIEKHDLDADTRKIGQTLAASRISALFKGWKIRRKIACIWKEADAFLARELEAQAKEEEKRGSEAAAAELVAAAERRKQAEIADEIRRRESSRVPTVSEILSDSVKIEDIKPGNDKYDIYVSLRWCNLCSLLIPLEFVAAVAVVMKKAMAREAVLSEEYSSLRRSRVVLPNIVNAAADVAAVGPNGDGELIYFVFDKREYSVEQLRSTDILRLYAAATLGTGHELVIEENDAKPMFPVSFRQAELSVAAKSLAVQLCRSVENISSVARDLDQPIRPNLTYRVSVLLSHSVVLDGSKKGGSPAIRVDTDEAIMSPYFMVHTPISTSDKIERDSIGIERIYDGAQFILKPSVGAIVNSQYDNEVDDDGTYGQSRSKFVVITNDGNTQLASVRVLVRLSWSSPCRHGATLKRYIVRRRFVTQLDLGKQGAGHRHGGPMISKGDTNIMSDCEAVQQVHRHASPWGEFESLHTAFNDIVTLPCRFVSVDPQQQSLSQSCTTKDGKRTSTKNARLFDLLKPLRSPPTHIANRRRGSAVNDFEAANHRGKDEEELPAFNFAVSRRVLIRLEYSIATETAEGVSEFSDIANVDIGALEVRQDAVDGLRTPGDTKKMAASRKTDTLPLDSCTSSSLPIPVSLHPRLNGVVLKEQLPLNNNVSTSFAGLREDISSLQDLVLRPPSSSAEIVTRGSSRRAHTSDRNSGTDLTSRRSSRGSSSRAQCRDHRSCSPHIVTTTDTGASFAADLGIGLVSDIAPSTHTWTLPYAASEPTAFFDPADGELTGRWFPSENFSGAASAQPRSRVFTAPGSSHAARSRLQTPPQGNERIRDEVIDTAGTSVLGGDIDSTSMSKLIYLLNKAEVQQQQQQQQKERHSSAGDDTCNDSSVEAASITYTDCRRDSLLGRDRVCSAPSSVNLPLGGRASIPSLHHTDPSGKAFSLSPLLPRRPATSSSYIESVSYSADASAVPKRVNTGSFSRGQRSPETVGQQLPQGDIPHVVAHTKPNGDGRTDVDRPGYNLVAGRNPNWGTSEYVECDEDAIVIPMDLRSIVLFARQQCQGKAVVGEENQASVEGDVSIDWLAMLSPLTHVVTTSDVHDVSSKTWMKS